MIFWKFCYASRQFNQKNRKTIQKLGKPHKKQENVEFSFKMRELLSKAMLQKPQHKETKIDKKCAFKPLLGETN
ncbi:hypothetical protein T4D_15046 [Trichinella pseudospiralis]|uniref:Uncharacterized protein n=1 Tax=Trichinella pseudospiralis TaxID=6337 RepID=A0A0V1F4M6_TRIPS|nr:hypothetical protein T4D_15046 [Trichinella pseudospiralis]